MKSITAFLFFTLLVFSTLAFGSDLQQQTFSIYADGTGLCRKVADQFVSRFEAATGISSYLSDTTYSGNYKCIVDMKYFAPKKAEIRSYSLRNFHKYKSCEQSLKNEIEIFERHNPEKVFYSYCSRSREQSLSTAVSMIYGTEVTLEPRRTRSVKDYFGPEALGRIQSRLESFGGENIQRFYWKGSFSFRYYSDSEFNIFDTSSYMYLPKLNSGFTKRYMIFDSIGSCQAEEEAIRALYKYMGIDFELSCGSNREMSFLHFPGHRYYINSGALDKFKSELIELVFPNTQECDKNRNYLVNTYPVDGFTAKHAICLPNLRKRYGEVKVVIIGE